MNQKKKPAPPPVQRPPVLDPLGGGNPRLDEEKLAELEKWFDENSKPLLTINDGPPLNVITVEMFQEFLLTKMIHRRQMHYPHYGEIMAEFERLNMAAVRVLTKEQFYSVVDSFLIMPDIKHELKLAYKLFDTEKRKFLDLDELYEATTCYGDKLEPDELSELMRDANYRGDGIVVHDEFVESMFRVAPELYDMAAEFLYEDPDEDPSVPPDVSIVIEPDPAKELFPKEAAEVKELPPDEKNEDGEIDGEGAIKPVDDEGNPIENAIPEGDAEVKAEGQPTEDLNEANKTAMDGDVTEKNAEAPVEEIEPIMEAVPSERFPVD